MHKASLVFHLDGFQQMIKDAGWLAQVRQPQISFASMEIIITVHDIKPAIPSQPNSFTNP